MTNAPQTRPEWLAHLQDAIFYGLPEPDRHNWPVQLAETLNSFPPEYDWQKAMHRVHISILQIAHKAAGPGQKVVQSAIDLHEKAARGEVVSDDAWAQAREWIQEWALALTTEGITAPLAELLAIRATGWSAMPLSVESAKSMAISTKLVSESAIYDMRDAILAALKSDEEPGR